jgi:uncharacterized protein YbjT (DUF2867 family)
MSELKNIVVVGGSGNVGKEVLAALVANKSDFGTISAIKREGVPASAILQKFEKQGVKLIEANLKDKSSLVKAFTGINVSCSLLIR